MRFIRNLLFPITLSLFLMVGCTSEHLNQHTANVNLESNASSLNQFDNSPLEELYFPAKIVNDVAYGSHPQEKFDIYLPAGRSYRNTKVLVLLHGGGWTNGDKANLASFVDRLWEENPNYAIVNMNYVLANASTPAFPNQFENIGSVLALLEENKIHFKIKPEFGLIGNSSGGHLALMYDYVYDVEDNVKFVSTIVGPTDFTHPFYENLPNFEDLMNLLVDPEVYPNIEENLNVLSPALNVTNAASPTILFYGQSDPLVPIANAFTLFDSLQSNNIPSDLNTYTGGHNNWSAQENNHKHEQLNIFIQQYLPLE